jgi:hypothetical protein
MKYSLIVPVTLSAKKGDTQTARFGITQSRPYPRITDRGLDNLGTLDPNPYRNTSVCLSNRYYLCLLSSAYTPETHTGDRTDHAGYEGRSGTLQFRGRDLGELCGEALYYHARNSHIVWRGEYPKTTREWLDEQAAPAILAAIHDNLASIREQTIAELEAHRLEVLAEAQANLDRAAAQYADIIATLKMGE